MSDFDPEVFEKELGKLRPARTPGGLLRRMADTTAIPRPERVPPGILQRFSQYWTWLRWAVAGTVAVAFLVGLVVHNPSRTMLPDGARSTPNSAKPLLKANSVELDQRLVASFDAVAELPDGEPVRLRCRQWLDAVVLRDSARGVVIERQSPRFEVVPVRFETY